MGVKIIRLEVQNFKSFKDKTNIPFSPDKLTVIVGPNGSGKSTIIEAISFILLATLSDLRGVRGDDLLPRGDRSSNNCVVRVTFELDGHQFSLSRVYSQDIQECRYFFGNEEIEIDDYKVLLQDYDIANALQISILKQEDINALASRNPEEWTKSFEKLSGSDSYKDDYEKTKKVRDEKQKEIHRMQQTVNKLNKANKCLKNHARYTEEVTKLDVLITLTEVLEIEKMISENIQKFNKLYNKSNELERQLEKEVDLREMSKLGNDLAGLELSNNRIVSEYQKCEKSLKVMQKRISSLCESKKTFMTRCENINKNNVQLHNENENLKEQSTIIEEELEKDSPDFDVTIQRDEDQMLAYLNAKEKFNEIASSIVHEVKDLKVEKIRLSNLLCNAKRKLENIETEQESLKKVSAEIAELKKKLDESYLGDTDKVQEELNQIWNKQSILMSKLDDIDNQLHEFERSETKRSERTRTDTVLKAEFGKRFYGRLVDLCHPVDPKYQIAFTRIMGPLLNAIVVQSQDVAIDCVELLKEKKLSAATFMGLDDLKFETPRTFPGLTRAYDLLKFDESIEKAVSFAVKNTVICEDAKSASEIRTKYQVDCVSLNGTLFKKSGAIYGGQAALEKQSLEWDHKLIQKLRQQQDVWQKELEELNRDAQRHRDLLIKIEQVDRATTTLRAQLKCLSFEEESLHSRIEEMQKHQPSLTEDKKRLQQEMDELNNKILEKENTVQKLKDETFREFCQTYGFNSIQEYEKNDLENYKKELEKRSELKVNQANIEYLIKTNETTIQENEEQLKKIQNRMTEIGEELKEAQKQLPKIKRQFELAAEKKNANESEMKQLTEEIQKLKIIDKGERDMQEQLNSLRGKIFLTKQKIFELKNKRYDILLDAVEVRELNLQIDKGKHRPANLNADNLTETSSLEDILESHFNYEVDFSDLPDHVQGKDVQALKEYREKLKTEKEKLEETIHMNIKQAELIKAGEGVDLVEIKTKLDDLKKNLNDINKNFKQIGRKRSEKLANYIQEIQESLNETYQTITENSSRIELISLDPQEVPFLGGIALYCKVPDKATREIKDLSGGEQAAAIFALYLAMNRMNSSFFLTDEVDAALDIVNVNSMCASMNDATDSVQVISTTFNEDIIGQAENLIGTYLDENGGTKILTL